MVTNIGILMFVLASILLFICGLKRSGFVKPSKSYFEEPPGGLERKLLLTAIWLVVASLVVIFIGKAHWGGY